MGKISHGSTIASVLSDVILAHVLLFYFITAHTFLLNPITADQCCLFHTWERNDLLESDIFSADFRAKASVASSPLWDYTLGVEDDL